MGVPGPNKVTSTDMKCKQSRILGNGNITEILNDLCEIEPEVDLATKVFENHQHKDVYFNYSSKMFTVHVSAKLPSSGCKYHIYSNKRRPCI
jgi:hypothetical protein